MKMPFIVFKEFLVQQFGIDLVFKNYENKISGEKRINFIYFFPRTKIFSGLINGL